MNAVVQFPRTLDFTPQGSTSSFEDPLDEDMPTDRVVMATARGLTRLALIAAETGARFQREGEGIDPMSWLLGARRLFAGKAAIDAVLSRPDFMRALLLHGLALGLDAEPHVIDLLTAGEEDNGTGLASVERADAERRDKHNARRGRRNGGAASAGGGCGRKSDRNAPPATEAGPRLYTATLVHTDGVSMLQAFHASICFDAKEAVNRLAWRYGPELAGAAQITIGFDPTTTFAEALVSPALSDLLMLVAADPTGPLAAGLDLNLEQRFLH